MYRRTGEMPQMLQDAPKLPAACGDLWHSFLDLHSSRGTTGFGPARISFSDIDAYSRVTRTPLAPWEIAAIRKADNAFLADHQSRQPRAD